MAKPDRGQQNQQQILIAAIQTAAELHQLGRWTEAEKLYSEVLAVDPTNFNALHLLAILRRGQGRSIDALPLVDGALQSAPSSAPAHSTRSAVLSDLGRHQEALASCDKALALNAADPNAWSNHGNALMGLGRHDQALASFDRALALDAGHADAWNNRGSVSMELGELDAACEAFEKAVAVRPNHADARLNLAHAQLVRGNFRDGWRGYEWRWKAFEGRRSGTRFDTPPWLGESSLSGKTVFLYAEQGLGDAIQFVRYAPLVAKTAERVVLEIPPPLKAILSNVAGGVSVIGQGEEIPDVDLHCPLLSLPLAFGTELDTIPRNVPYIQAAPERVTAWENRLPARTCKRVGLVWAGNPAYRRDASRSPGLAPLVPLLRLPRVQLFSLQRDLRPGDDAILREHSHVVRLGNHLQDFADTAALVEAMDLIVTSDTSMAHLAGAMGKPVWVLLSFAADWRWLRERQDSPWYPTARLFRQPAVGDWDSVIASVAEELGRA